MRISDWSSDVCSSDLTKHAIDLGMVSSTFRVILKPGHDIGVEPNRDRLLDGLVKARSARMQTRLSGIRISNDTIALINRTCSKLIQLILQRRLMVTLTAIVLSGSFVPCSPCSHDHNTIIYFP